MQIFCALLSTSLILNKLNLSKNSRKYHTYYTPPLLQLSCPQCDDAKGTAKQWAFASDSASFSLTLCVLEIKFTLNVQLTTT